QDEFSQYLKNAEVVILPDNDKPGIQGAQKIAQKLSHSAKSVRIFELPNLGPITEHHGKDFSDWLDIPGNDAEKLQELAKSALRITPPP
ncbi:MAG: topoisomerase, partial [SAR324 cluster bacterium]|nr:topoisomerase [SAR324 cluster bacterium]